MEAINLPSTFFVDIIVILVTMHTASSILKRYCYKSNTQRIGSAKIKVAQKNLNRLPVHINYYTVN